MSGQREEVVVVDFYINAEELAKLIGKSKSTANKLIAKLNQEQAKMGKIIFRGQVSKKYVRERLGLPI